MKKRIDNSYFQYEEDACEQTGDCMNDSEYGEFMRKYHLGKRKKRQVKRKNIKHFSYLFLVLYPTPRKEVYSMSWKAIKGKIQASFWWSNN